MAARSQGVSLIAVLEIALLPGPMDAVSGVDSTGRPS
jgi:hypothetical protein